VATVPGSMLSEEKATEACPGDPGYPHPCVEVMQDIVSRSRRRDERSFK